MKKVLSIAMVAMVSATLFAGCTGGSSSAKFKDGSYTAEFKEEDSKGWKEFVTVTVKDGKVADILLDGKNAKGENKTKLESYNEKMKEISKVDPKTAFPQITDQYKKSGKIDDVKKVAGATHTTDNFIAMMKGLEPKMEKGDTTPFLYEAPKQD